MSENKDKQLKPTWDNVRKTKFLSDAKCDIGIHKARRKVLIGAKNCGKTIVGVVDGIVSWENDSYANLWGIKRWQRNAAQSMSSYALMVQSLMKAIGFFFPREYKQTQSELYRVSYKNNNQKNQRFDFGSLENPTQSTDGKPPAFGYISTVIMDEPVEEKDALEPGKLISSHEWEKVEEVLTSNLTRYTESHMDAFPDRSDKTKPTTIWMLMNNWGPHPIIVEADEFFPESDFIDWVLGYPLDTLLGNEELVLQLWKDEEYLKGLVERNTLSKYDREKDTLFSRFTVFGNPRNCVGEKLQMSLVKIRNALIEAKPTLLTIYLGMRQTPMLEDSMRVFPEQVIKNHSNKTMEQLLKEGFKPTHVSYGVDVDISRIITIAPAIYMQKVASNGDVTNIVHIDPIKEYKTAGAGAMGQNLDQYTKFASKLILEHIVEKKLLKCRIKVSVDDNLSFFMRDMSRTELSAYVNQWGKPIKTGANDITHRQDLLIAGLRNKVINIEPKNALLISDYRTCQKVNMYEKKRETKGTKNYLDRIDAVDYAIQPFTSMIWRELRGGRNG